MAILVDHCTLKRVESDGSSRCSSVHSPSQRWCAERPSSLTSFPSTTTHRGPLILLQWFVIAFAKYNFKILFTFFQLAIASICLFIILPLTLVGTVLGRNVSGAANNPCRVNAVPRPIPEKKWFMEPLVIVLLGGILPFGSIFIEMYFIFTSFWAYKIYYVYGFMMLVFLILTAVTSCVTIVCTYFLLNAEDYRW